MYRLSFKKRFSLVILIALLMYALHNNFWSWRFDTVSPTILGFMPFAFFYYVVYTVLATVSMYLIIALAWPDPPEELLLPARLEEDGKK